MEKKGILLTNRHVSLLLSFFILSSFFVFISGYFFGKKKAVEKFYSKVDQESLADHVYYSVCSNYGNYDRQQEQESAEDSEGSEDSLGNSEVGNLEKDSKDIASDKNGVKGVKVAQAKQVNLTQENLTQEDLVQEEKDSQKTGQEGQSQNQKSSENYYAELVGFGTKIAANAFCDKLKKQGMTVALRKRISRTSRGKNIYWYQVVTEKFDNKSDLVAFVDIIKDKENLKGVKIVEC